MSERLPVQLASRQLGLKCVVRPESRFDPTVIRSQVLPTVQWCASHRTAV